MWQWLGKFPASQYIELFSQSLLNGSTSEPCSLLCPCAAWYIYEPDRASGSSNCGDPRCKLICVVPNEKCTPGYRDRVIDEFLRVDLIHAEVSSSTRINVPRLARACIESEARVPQVSENALLSVASIPTTRFHNRRPQILPVAPLRTKRATRE